MLYWDTFIVIVLSDEHKAELRARVGRPQTSKTRPPPPPIYNRWPSQGGFLFWFFGNFRCGALLIMVIHVIYKYKNR